MPDKPVNKVVYGEEVLIDLTDTTATADKILVGYGAYGKDGAWMDGAAPEPNPDGKVYQDENGYVVLDDDQGTNVDIDALNVTENGTYTASTGHAYSPVSVNVTAPVQSVNGQTGVVVLDADDVGALPDDTVIPTKTSDLTNDSGFITTETDPTVPSWAKASTKPSYTASEVGALPDDTSIPTKISDLTNDQVYDLGTKTLAAGGQMSLTSEEQSDILAMWNRGACAINVTISGKTCLLLKEQDITYFDMPLHAFSGAWAGFDANGNPISKKIALAVSTLVSYPVAIYAEVNDVVTVNGYVGTVVLDADDVGALPDDTVIPSKTSDLTNDSGFITTETDPTVPSWAKASTKPSYTASEVGAVSTSAIGAASGVVPLNASSKIDESYLPSYVDDVIEGYFYNDSFYKESSHTTVITGEAGKIYVDLATDKTYRYGGSTFVEISSGTTVSVSRDLTTGTKIATITVNGTGSDLYAPTQPTKVSDLTNDSGFITGVSSSDVTTALGYTPYNASNPNGYVNSTGAANAAPVQSVNGQTGTVVLDADDIGALPNTTSIPSKTSDLTNDSGFITTETDPTVPAWAKASTKPSYTAAEVGALPDDTVIPSKTSDLTNDSRFITGMTILSYGSSTWQDFLDAYNANKVVYCRASSNSNPASGSQTRLAFMAYVSNATNPANVEFQYYRSMSSHTATQQGDEVYVYKLASTGTWTVTVRKASSNIVAGTGLSRSYSNDTVTLSLDGTIPTKTSDLTNDSGYLTLSTLPVWDGSVT